MDPGNLIEPAEIVRSFFRQGAKFPTFDNEEQLSRCYNNLPGADRDHGLDTFFGSRLETDNNSLNARGRIMQNPELGPVIMSDYLTGILKQAAPRKLGLWNLNTKVWDVCFTEINKAGYNNLIDAFQNSSDKATTTLAELQMYQEKSIEFRQSTLQVLDNALYSGGNEPINQQFAVSATQAAELQMMLQSIVAKRRAQLNNQGVLGAANDLREHGQRLGAQHYFAYVDYIRNEGPSLLPIKKRGIRGTATRIIGAEFDDIPTRDEVRGGNTHNGYLLLSTALMEHIRRTNQTIENFNQDNRAPMIAARAEVRHMLENQNVANNQAGGNYLQQCANLDIVFNFFLWLRGSKMLEQNENADLTFNENKKLMLNSFLYMIGQKLHGAQVVERILRSMPVWLTRLGQYVNKTGSIHMPPYAITYKRMYDMVAFFGVLKVTDLQLSVENPAVSTRYLIGFRPTRELPMRIITAYWFMENNSAGHNRNQDISESEHMLHQMLQSKTSPYQSTIGKAGNVFNITIIPAMN